MTTIYINGKRVTKEEIKKIEIHSERVKKILADKLAEKKQLDSVDVKSECVI